MILNRTQATEYLSNENFDAFTKSTPIYDDAHLIQFVLKYFVTWSSFDANELAPAVNVCAVFYDHDPVYQKLFKEQSDLQQIQLFNSWIEQPFDK
jgi:hypothetical protein